MEVTIVAVAVGVLYISSSRLSMIDDSMSNVTTTLL